MRAEIVDAATEAAFGVGWRAVKRMPESTSDALFRRLADRAWRKSGASVRQLETNLRRVRPDVSEEELRELSHAGMRSYLRYWNEAFRLPAWSHERISTTFDLQGHEVMDAALASGQGIIMAPGHMANWDHAGAWAALRYGSVTTVAERLKPEGVFNQFLEYRQTLGMNVVPHGSPDVIRSLARTLNSGGLVALLGDRDVGRNGVDVRMFGEVARIPGGPALLSMLTGAPLYPVSMWFDGAMLRGQVYPAVPIPETGDKSERLAQMCQGLADSLCDGIRQHPADWHMMQKVWVSDL
jgi:phosphatidylinositol dimannoside acyltransferase